ncbi:MAG: NADH-quinone oxidoreductase subunit M [Pirellulales bacterium]
MNDSLILLATLLVPLLGAGVICALAPAGRGTVRWVAALTSVVALVGAAVLAMRFPGGMEVFAPASWRAALSEGGLDVRLSLGLDGLSIWLFALSALLTLTSVLVSWEAIRERPAAFYALLLILETGLMGVFAARDLILFYIFFEFTLIPLFFLIGIWGSEERRYAAVKFFIFTLAGSLLTFLGLLALVLWNQQAAGGELVFSIPELTAGLARVQQADPNLVLQSWIFLALFAGFAIKVPLFPLHTWLPLAHVQAPTAGSVMLAGVLLKIGTYGFLRFSMPMLPHATMTWMPPLLWLSVAGIIYGALVALAQTDIKRLIAYSSVSHLGFCMLGLFAVNRLGVQGGTLQMINHGLSTGGLFACVGIIYERYHTRQINELGGLARGMPILAFFMLVFTLASIGLPGLNGFVGEFLLLLGMFQRGWNVGSPWETQFLVIAVLAVFGVVLGAWYMLWLIERTFFGPPHQPAHDELHEVHDLTAREIAALTPLAVLIVWIGVQPHVFLEPMAPVLDNLVEVVQRADLGPSQGMASTEDGATPGATAGLPSSAVVSTEVASITNPDSQAGPWSSGASPSRSSAIPLPAGADRSSNEPPLQGQAKRPAWMIRPPQEGNAALLDKPAVAPNLVTSYRLQSSPAASTEASGNIVPTPPSGGSLVKTGGRL